MRYNPSLSLSAHHLRLLCAVVIVMIHATAHANTDPCTQDTAPCSSNAQQYQFNVKLSPESPDRQDMFGLSVAVGEKWLFAGAPWDSSKAYRAGIVQSYKKTASGWTQDSSILPKKSAGKSLFGSTLAWNGKYLAVGAPGEHQGKLISAGAVYVFEYVDTEWKHVARLTSTSVMAGDFFGSALAWSGDQLIVGAHLDDDQGIDSGAVYYYGTIDGGWKQLGKIQPDDIRAGTLFGNAVAATETTLAIGAYGHDGLSPGGGAVYLYEKKPDSTWKFSTILQAEYRKAFSEFGWSLDISDDTLMVGAPYEDETDKLAGAVYVFNKKDNTNWVQHTRLTYNDPHWKERFGASVALLDDAALISAPYGVAYVFDKQQKSWEQSAKVIGQAPFSDNLFSRAVAAHQNTIVLGVPSQQGKADGAGAVYVFERADPPSPTNAQ